jgi:hypothetical protein
VDHTGRHAAKAALHGLDRVPRLEERADIRFGQVQGHPVPVLALPEMRTMFTAYWIFILAGLALFFYIGIADR